MPNEPASRKTALVTPKNQKPISHEQLDFVIAADLRTLRTYFLNGEFRKANNFLHEKVIKEGVSRDQRELFNVCLIYVFLKLKEYENAKTLAQDLLGEYERQDSLSLESDEREFPVKFLLATSLYELKQNDSLQIFYEIIADMKSRLNKAKTRPAAIPKKKEQWNALDSLHMEVHELFGAFPKRDDLQAKYIMVAFEICRVHTRMQDYRNAYKIITSCAKMFPKNPYVLSKAGRLCLETGRKNEAKKYFNTVKGMIHDQGPSQSSSEAESILGAIEKQQSLSEPQKMLHVLDYFNSAFLAVFDGNFTEAIESFRQVQNYKPANIVAANNIATC